MKYSWGRGQLTFVPEGESEFEDPHTGDLLTIESKTKSADVIPIAPDVPEMRSTGDLDVIEGDGEEE